MMNYPDLSVGGEHRFKDFANFVGSLPKDNIFSALPYKYAHAWGTFLGFCRSQNLSFDADAMEHFQRQATPPATKALKRKQRDDEDEEVSDSESPPPKRPRDASSSRVSKTAGGTDSNRSGPVRRTKHHATRPDSAPTAPPTGPNPVPTTRPVRPSRVTTNQPTQAPQSQVAPFQSSDRLSLQTAVYRQHTNGEQVSAIYFMNTYAFTYCMSQVTENSETEEFWELVQYLGDKLTEYYHADFEGASWILRSMISSIHSHMLERKAAKKVAKK